MNSHSYLVKRYYCLAHFGTNFAHNESASSSLAHVCRYSFYKFQNKKFDCINQIIGTAIAIHTTANMKKNIVPNYIR